MRKLLVLGLFAVLALSFAAPILAADEGDQKWHIHGDVRARGDYFNNIFDYADTSNGGVPGDTFGFWPFMVQVAVDGQLAENVHGMVSVRNDETFGGAPSAPALVGADPTVVSESYNAEADVRLYQAFVDFGKIGGTGLSVRVGRAEHTLGTELLMGDNDFYTGQTFDGVRLMWNADKWDVDAFYYKILELNYNPTFNGTAVSNENSSDANFMGATFDWKFESLGQLDVYYLRFQDLDNTGANFLPGGGDVDTFGARWGRMVDHEKGMFDWNIEYAAQSGSVGTGLAETDLKGDILEGWFGFNIHGAGHHRFHVGYLQASGDEAGAGSPDFEGFVPLFGDNHAYNRLGNLDNFALSNIQDISIGYDGWFGAEKKHHLMAAYHQLTLDQALPVIGGTEDDLGSVWDIGYGYEMNKNLSFEVDASQGQGGKVQDLGLGTAFPTPTNGSSDNAERYYAQVHFTW